MELCSRHHSKHSAKGSRPFRRPAARLAAVDDDSLAVYSLSRRTAVSAVVHDAVEPFHLAVMSLYCTMFPLRMKEKNFLIIKRPTGQTFHSPVYLCVIALVADAGIVAIAVDTFASCCLSKAKRTVTKMMSVRWVD